MSRRGVEAALDNAEDGWARAVHLELVALAASGLAFTIADLRRKLGEPDHPSRWGAITAGARRTGLIESIGITHGRDGNLIHVWRGVRRDGPG
jgi:hypothetical protein